MSYINFINKLSSDVKKVSNDYSHTEEELKKYKASLTLFPKFNKNSIGYKIKFLFQLDKEHTDKTNLISLQIIINYIVENFISNHELSYFRYHIYENENSLILSLFHTNKNYIELISDNVINYITKELQNLSSQIKAKFINIPNLSTRTKIKILQKEFPILIDILCNTINKKDFNVPDIIDSIIKLMYINDTIILKDNDIKYTTYISFEDPVEILTKNITENKRKNNDELNITKKQKTNDNLSNEILNDNIKHLFWHTLDRKKNIESNDIFHSVIFLIILGVVIYLFPNYIQKFMDFRKSNSIIDNILDIATDDLTSVIQNKSNTQNINSNSRNNSPKRSESPIRNKSPPRIPSPKRNPSPIRNKSPKRYQSPIRNKSPKRYQSPDRNKSPKRHQSPDRNKSPKRHQSPRRRKSPVRKNEMDRIFERERKHYDDDSSVCEPNEYVHREKTRDDDDEDIGMITRNIIKKFNDFDSTNQNLLNIENRLRYILEETDSKP